MAFPKTLPANLQHLRGTHSVFEVDHSLGDLREPSVAQDLIQWISPELQPVRVEDTPPNKISPCLLLK